MKAFFIGRFQPFHNGHLKVIKHFFKKYDEIIIGIGSSQYSDTFDNPFTSDERKKMIDDTLIKHKISKYKIILIPDIHNPPKWVDHILSIYSDFEVVITNSKLTMELFSEKGFKIVQPPMFEKEKYSGQEIRRRMRKDELWQECVPSEVIKIILEIDGVNRIKKID